MHLLERFEGNAGSRRAEPGEQVADISQEARRLAGAILDDCSSRRIGGVAVDAGGLERRGVGREGVRGVDDHWVMRRNRVEFRASRKAPFAQPRRKDPRRPDPGASASAFHLAADPVLQLRDGSEIPEWLRRLRRCHVERVDMRIDHAGNHGASATLDDAGRVADVGAHVLIRSDRHESAVADRQRRDRAELVVDCQHPTVEQHEIGRARRVLRRQNRNERGDQDDDEG